MHYRIINLSLLILLCATFAFTQNDTNDEITRQFAEITKGADSKARSLEIREELEKMRVKYSYIPFSMNSRGGAKLEGWNIIAEIDNPNAEKTLMIGAHYDRVSKGIGAVDNASGSIAILHLLKEFKANPLKNYDLKVAFWDLEERGLLGARNYVETHKEDLPEIYINFDVFGYGDTLWLWAKDQNAAFAKSFDKTSKDEKFSSIISNKYPPSDHLAFASTDTETYSFSLLNKDEIGNLTKLLNREELKPEEFPEVIKIIHTENDNLEKINSKQIEMSFPVIIKAIRGLDK